MLFKLNISGGKKYIYHDLIINISNPIFNENIVELNINNITIYRYVSINDLYQLIFYKLKDKLVKLLYNNDLLKLEIRIINFLLI